jgi:integrase
VREEFGSIEMAQDALGHRSVAVTAIYAERSRRRLIEVAKKMG